MPIIVNLDVMLAKRKMSLTELCEQVGVTMSNLSHPQNWKGKSDSFLNIRSHMQSP